PGGAVRPGFSSRTRPYFHLCARLREQRGAIQRALAAADYCKFPAAETLRVVQVRGMRYKLRRNSSELGRAMCECFQANGQYQVIGRDRAAIVQPDRKTAALTGGVHYHTLVHVGANRALEPQTVFGEFVGT